MNGEGDTELLLVLLMSLLEPPFPPHASLLNALVDCNGDVNLAAQHIQRQITGKSKSTTQVSQKKRKLEESGLDNWLLSSRASSSNKRLSENLGTRKEDPVPLLDRNGGISSKKPHSEGPSSSSTSKTKSKLNKFIKNFLFRVVDGKLIYSNTNLRPLPVIYIRSDQKTLVFQDFVNS